MKEFLEPQLRDASSKNLEAGFQLNFTEGLSMRGGATVPSDRAKAMNGQVDMQKTQRDDTMETQQCG